MRQDEIRVGKNFDFDKVDCRIEFWGLGCFPFDRNRNRDRNKNRNRSRPTTQLRGDVHSESGLVELNGFGPVSFLLPGQG